MKLLRLSKAVFTESRNRSMTDASPVKLIPTIIMTTSMATRYSVMD